MLASAAFCQRERNRKTRDEREAVACVMAGSASLRKRLGQQYHGLLGAFRRVTVDMPTQVHVHLACRKHMPLTYDT